MEENKVLGIKVSEFEKEYYDTPYENKPRYISYDNGKTWIEIKK